MDVVVDTARPGDVVLLAAVERDGDRRYAGYAGLPPGFDGVVPVPVLSAGQADGRLWVARTGDGTVVGFALAERVDDAAHLEQLSVVRAHQGMGVGRRLVAAVHAWARGAGLPAVTLCTFADVGWNRPLYEHLGFVVVPQHEWTPGLRAVFARDAGIGLDMSRRVVMRLGVAPDAGGGAAPLV